VSKPGAHGVERPDLAEPDNVLEVPAYHGIKLSEGSQSDVQHIASDPSTPLVWRIETLYGGDAAVLS
jgi:hypothetical protein